EVGDPAALSLDVVRVEIRQFGTAVLVAPTHPLRLLWLLQEQQLARSWADEALSREDEQRGIIETWRSSLSLQGLPPLAVLSPQEGYHDAGPLLGGWGVYGSQIKTDPVPLLPLIAIQSG